MTDTPSPRRLRLAALPRHGAAEVLYVPDAADRAALAGDLGLLDLRKVRLAGRLLPEGRRGWRLEAMLGATVVQPCAITLAPVTTRIDAALHRDYREDFAPPAEAESEVPEDVDVEPLPDTLDLHEVLAEALALELPDFPRAPGADLGELRAAPPGADPDEGSAERPFAALAALRRPPQD
jgi:uncharacterized metal-binding protein YceD (DUF177 family)